MVSSQGQRIKPKLARGPIPLHMNVLRFVAVEAVEEDPVRAGDVGNRGHHPFRAGSISLLHRIIHGLTSPRAPTVRSEGRRASHNRPCYGSGRCAPSGPTLAVGACGLKTIVFAARGS